MSIYTEMIDIINKRGLQKGSPISVTTGRCCLLGARALALGVDPEPEVLFNYSDLYSTEGIEELVELTSEEVPDDEEPFKNSIDAVWYYNDIVIEGNKAKAIDMLSKAEILRVLNDAG
jgi:hypothetical protein